MSGRSVGPTDAAPDTLCPDPLADDDQTSEKWARWGSNPRPAD